MMANCGNSDIVHLRNGIIRYLQQRPRKLNILVVGSTGVGKSSFISSMAAALSGEYHEIAVAGHHGGGGRPITAFMTRYGNCGLDEMCCSRLFKDCQVPTLIDLAGLPTENANGIYEELLRTILYGRLPETMSIVRAVEILTLDGIEALRKKCPLSDPDLMIDRVLFLSSATENVLPEELIRCVVEDCIPVSDLKDNRIRVVPLYGVMTKKDKVKVDSTSYKVKEKNFLENLGIMGYRHRFLMCKNYCDDTAPERGVKKYPSLDAPLLQFFSQLVDPFVVVQNDGEREDFRPFYEIIGLPLVGLLAVICLLVYLAFSPALLLVVPLLLLYVIGIYNNPYSF